MPAIPAGTKLTASKAVEFLKANYEDFLVLDLSGSFTLTSDQACAIAEALEGNTTLLELRLQSVRLTNVFATAAAKMLRVNHTLRLMDLEDNKIDSDGIEEIGAALADNRGLIEMTLLKNREPGEKALATLIASFDYNTTLQRINWRLTSRQSFTLTKKLSRNVEILRRKDAGLDYSDIDPYARREKDKELLASGTAGLAGYLPSDDADTGAVGADDDAAAALKQAADDAAAAKRKADDEARKAAEAKAKADAEAAAKRKEDESAVPLVSPRRSLPTPPARKSQTSPAAADAPASAGGDDERPPSLRRIVSSVESLPTKVAPPAAAVDDLKLPTSAAIAADTTRRGGSMRAPVGTVRGSSRAGDGVPPVGTKLAPSKAVELLRANAAELTNLDLSGSFTLSVQQATDIVEALHQNTVLQELHLASVRLTNQFATAAAKMLRHNHTLRVLNLEDNKIDSDGIEEIGAALAENRGLIEMTLLKNREPGEKALATLIASFDYNTTLQRINWRLTSRQSFTLTKKLSRNVEILRRKEAGMDYSDIDPHARREKDKELLASGNAGVRAFANDDADVPLPEADDGAAAAAAAAAKQKADEAAAAAAKKKADDAAAAAAVAARKANEEAAAKKKMADEAAAKKKFDEEAAAKKKADDEIAASAAVAAAAAEAAAADAAKKRADEEAAAAAAAAAKKKADDEAAAAAAAAAASAEEAEKEDAVPVVKPSVEGESGASEAALAAASAAAATATKMPPTLSASKAVEYLKANAADFTSLDLSGSFTLTPEQACAIAEALEVNTHVTELHLRSVRLTNVFAAAAAKMLRVNHTLRLLDLEDNKIDSDGIEEIGAALAENRGLIEMTLLKNREPGEKALSVLIRSFDSNTTLQRINWRLTSRQSFALTKLLSRNVEILRRKEAGLDYSDIDPIARREKDKELLANAASSPALRRRAEDSPKSSPGLAPRRAASNLSAEVATADEEAEAEAKRVADEQEAAATAAAAATKKLAEDEAAAKKKAEEEAAAATAAAKKKAEDEAAAAAAAAAKKKADDEAAAAAAAAAKKKADDEAAAKKKADEEAAAAAAAAAAKKMADDAAAAQKKADDEAAAAAKKKADDEAAAAKKKADDEAAAAAAAAAEKKQAEDDAAAAAAAAKKNAEEEAAAAAEAAAAEKKTADEAAAVTVAAEKAPDVPSKNDEAAAKLQRALELKAKADKLRAEAEQAKARAAEALKEAADAEQQTETLRTTLSRNSYMMLVSGKVAVVPRDSADVQADLNEQKREAEERRLNSERADALVAEEQRERVKKGSRRRRHRKNKTDSATAEPAEPAEPDEAKDDEEPLDEKTESSRKELISSLKSLSERPPQLKRRESKQRSLRGADAAVVSPRRRRKTKKTEAGEDDDDEIPVVIMKKY
jgi:hypothetical protein